MKKSLNEAVLEEFQWERKGSTISMVISVVATSYFVASVIKTYDVGSGAIAAIFILNFYVSLKRRQKLDRFIRRLKEEQSSDSYRQETSA